jgi:hypothetical protein
VPDVAALSVNVTADTSQLEAGLHRANQSVSGFGSTLAGIGTATATALAGVGVAAAAGLGSAIKTAADFEKQVSAIGAVAGASDSEMQALTKSALQLGKDTSFSAAEAAKGMEELIKAGVSVESVIGGAGRAVLDLSAASGTAVAESATIMSNALNVFKDTQLTAEQAANILAGASNASATSVHELGYAMAASGNVASMLGFTFEETATALAMFADAGLRGSDAGTSFKTMMMNLIPQTNKEKELMNELGLVTFNAEKAMRLLADAGITTDGTTEGMVQALVRLNAGVSQTTAITPKMYEQFNKAAISMGIMQNEFFKADGTIKPLAEVFETLKKSLVGMTREQQINAIMTIFGTDATRAAAIANKMGAEGVATMTEKMRKQGDAQKIANERLNNLAGSWEKFTGSLETGAIILGSNFTPALKKMVDALTDSVNQGIDIMERLPDAWTDVLSIFREASTTGHFEGLLQDLGLTEAATIALTETMAATGAFITGTLVPVIQQLAGWFTANLAPIATFVGAFTGVIVTAGLVTVAINGVIAVFGFLLSPIGLVAVAVATLAVAWQTNFLGIQEATAALWAMLQPILAGMVDWLGAKIPPVLTWISETGWPALVSAGEAVATFTTGQLIPALTQLVDWFGPKLQPVVTWLSGTGWPGLTAAMQEGQRIGLLVIKFVQDLWAELEKRGIVDGATQAFTNLHAILEPVFNVLSLIVGVAVKVIGFLADLAAKGLESGAGVKFVADQLERFFAPIAEGLGTLAKLIEMLRSLGNIQMPSWWGSNPFGSGGGSGGGSTLSTLSWRGAGAANPNASQSEVEQFAYQAAKGRGWSEEKARELVALINGEAAGQGARALGDSGRSHGPLQLFTGGGLGNVALDAGINVRDPSTWQQQVLFGMETIEREGAGQWTVARNRNLLQTPPVRVSVPNAGAAALPQMAQLTQGQWGAQVGMTPAEAQAACGPYAAFLFAQATGRTPNQQEAEQLARLSGWNEVKGMGGTANFVKLLGRLGVNAVATGTGDWSNEAITNAAANAGPLTGFSTAEHYFASTGFDPKTGKFNVGTSGKFVGGSEWMSVADMERISGNIQDIVTLAGQMGPAFQQASAETGASLNQMGAATAATGEGFAQFGIVVVDGAAQIIETTAAQSSAVTQSYDLMATGAVESVTGAAGAITTSITDTAGNYITTVTDMSGQVLAQYGTLANGATVSMQDLGTQTTATVDAFTGHTIQTVTDAMGNVLTTIIGTNGQIIAQTVETHGQLNTTWTETSAAIIAKASEMGLQVIGQTQKMGEVMVTNAKTSTGEMVKVVTDATGNVVKVFSHMANEVGATVVHGLDAARKGFDQLTGSMRKTEDQAKKTASAIAKLGGDTGNKQFAKGAKGTWDIDGKALGGPVDIGETYWVGERGPELFTASRSGTIIPNHALSSSVIDYDRLASALARAMPSRGDINVYGAGTEDVADRVLREMRRERMHAAMQGRGS